jgi:hypothetical protein
MSPAFVAALLWLCATVLWWSGWREEAADGIPHWGVGVYLAVWPVAFLWNIAPSSLHPINGAWAWTWLAIILLAWRTHPARRWTALSAGILFGSIYFLLSRLSYYPSALSHLIAPWGMAIAVGWLSAILLRNSSEQILAISTAFFLNDCLDATLFSNSSSFMSSEASVWLERWWIGILFARTGSVSFQSIVDRIRRWSLRMGWRKGGQRW